MKFVTTSELEENSIEFLINCAILYIQVTLFVYN